MRIGLYTAPRGKFVGIMPAFLKRVILTSGGEEVELSIWSETGPQSLNLRLTLAEAGELARSLAALAPTEVAPCPATT